MTYIYLIAAILCLTTGHFFQTFRWKQFISIYEKPDDRRLLQSLSLGYILNFYLPFRLGDMFRAIFSGKKMKNGISFSLATVIVGRYLDVLFVGLVFILFLLSGSYDQVILESALFYIAGVVMIFLLSLLFLKYNRLPKLLIRKFAGIFNEKIELKILVIFWCFITAFRDMYQRTNRVKLIANTLIMWSFYLCSYYLLALSLNHLDNTHFQFRDVFMLLFSPNDMNYSFFKPSFSELNAVTVVSVAFLFAPLLLVFVASLLVKRVGQENNTEFRYSNILPHQHKKDKLAFLENYFSVKNSAVLKKYLDVTSEVLVLEDCSAGSDATTLLCYDNNHNFYRKYAIGKGKEKLNEQLIWLQEYKKYLPLTKVLQFKLTEDYCYYDMEYDPKAIVFFNHIHSSPPEINWENLQQVLKDLRQGLYSIDAQLAESFVVKSYIEEKVRFNLQKVKGSKLLKDILKYDNLIINGKPYKNLLHYEQFLSDEYLYDIFRDDFCCKIHGDLTIENIVIVSGKNEGKPYYLIDPNTGNILDSDNLDYAKLLQSLHGGYEFLMKTQQITYSENKINFISTKSSAYEMLYDQFQGYMKEEFHENKIKSIYFHEIVHWLRLLPYKLEKNGERALLFYAGFIIILNEIMDNYEKRESSTF